MHNKSLRRSFHFAAHRGGKLRTRGKRRLRKGWNQTETPGVKIGKMSRMAIRIFFVISWLHYLECRIGQNEHGS